MNYRRRLMHAALALLLLGGSAAQAGDKLLPNIRLCMTDIDVAPWVVSDSSGLINVFLNDLARRLNLSVDYERMPARRCYLELQRGESDATLGSYAPERGAYPMLGGQPDARRRIVTMSYSLFRPKGAPLRFDGKRISGASLPIAILQGTSVGDLIKQMDLQVDDSGRQPEQLFSKVLIGRASAAALLTDSGDLRLKLPEFAGKLERVDPPLTARAYYLILSSHFVERHPALAEQIWDMVAVVRESPAFKKKYDEAH